MSHYKYQAASLLSPFPVFNTRKNYITQEHFSVNKHHCAQISTEVSFLQRSSCINCSRLYLYKLTISNVIPLTPPVSNTDYSTVRIRFR